MRWRLSPETAKVLDFNEAVRHELEHPRDSLPSRVVESALHGHEADVAKRIKASALNGLELRTGPIIWMPKPDHIGRYRPVVALTFEERVLFRAFAIAIEPYVPGYDRGPKAHAELQEAPRRSTNAFVALADVASFYAYIDHQVLATRVVEACAQPDWADDIASLLSGVMGREYGLPQSFSAADPLSELIIGPVERRMVRAGFETFRVNDDFRFTTASRDGGLRALETLQAELWALGLALNDDKSWVLQLQTYSDNLDRAHELLDDYTNSTDLSLSVDPYTGEPLDDEEAESEIDVGFMAGILEAAAERRLGEQRLDPFESTANRRIIVTAIAFLVHEGDPRGMDAVVRLLGIDPLLARQFAVYVVASLPATDRAGRVLDALGSLGELVPAWVELWLIEPFCDRSTHLTADARAWLARVASERDSDLLRARALLALATHEAVDRAAVAATYDAISPTARPDVVAAAARAVGKKATLSAITQGDPLAKRVAEWAVDEVA